MKLRWVIAPFLWFLLGASVSFALAQGKGHGPKKKDTAVSDNNGSTNVRVVFSSGDRSAISSWFHERGSGGGLPPGLAKRDRLPPGLERQLRERGSLPPGLQKKLVPLPVVLDRRVVPLPEGYRRSVIGAHVVITNSRGTFVFDVLRDVVPY